MNIPLLLRQLRDYWRPILFVHLIFTLLGVAIITPLFGMLVRALLDLSGSAAVADQDIALLLLSPVGAVSGVVLVSLLLAIAGLEMGALQAVAQGANRSVRVAPMAAAMFALRHALPLLRLTLGFTLRVLVYLLPFLAGVGLVAWLLLSDHDINYYLAERPAEFYYALAAAGAMAVLLCWLLGRRLLCWSLALPLMLFGRVPPEQTFRESERIGSGHRGALVRAFLGWLLVANLLALIPVLFLDVSIGWIMGSPHERLTPLLLALGATALVWSVMNFFVAALNLGSLNLVIAHLYERFGPPLTAELIAAELREAESAAGSGWTTTRVALVVVLAAGLALLAGGWLLKRVTLEDDVLVVAHRGAAGAAPENTIASIRRAVADGADWVEIDVQESRDGQVVVVHDSDFMKLAGNPLKVWEGDLAEIRQIDVGSWFDPAFASERVPTLAAVLEEIRGRSRLVIELKYYGHDQRLEERVVDLVESAGMADDVVIMSLKLPGIQKLQALRPEWTAGLLAATAVGDLTRLDIDFLAVNENLASRGFIRRAHAAGKRVFVWTINDAQSLSRWMSMGVDGVITDEPALARQVLREREGLSSAERLLLSAAFFFGRPEIAGDYRDNSP
jgi:glycerophosphoryl diester phosphodiesterase